MTFTRSGITANLVPTVSFNPSVANTISIIDTFQESTNLLPLASKAPAPGNQVAHLVFTLSDSAPPGSSIAITLDPSVTLLSDEGGNTSESPANGTLVLVDGAINIPSQMVTTPVASMAQTPAEAVPSAIKTGQSLRPARFLNNARLTAVSTRFSPRTSSYLGTTNHDAAFGYDEAGDVLHDDQGRTFTYDALSMTTGATAPFTNGGGIRTLGYIYTADDERIALVETLPSSATTTTWTLRGLDNHLLRTWTNSSTSGWSWREDDIWRGATLLAYESATTGVRHYGLDHLGSPAIITDALGHSVGPVTFDAFGNGGATGAGMLQYTGHERDSFNVGPSPGTVTLPDYLHARYYDSARGRFLSTDPDLNLKATLHNPQKWNRYAYVVNNPVLYVDSTGRQEHAAFLMDRDVQDLLAHRISEKEYWARLNARGVGALFGAAPWAGWWGASTVMSWFGVGAASASGGTVLLGETMPGRVQTLATEMNAETFDEAWSGDKAQMIARNLTWLQSKVDSGARIFDLGKDALRQVPSDFHAAETTLMQNNGFVQQFVKFVIVGGEVEQLFQWVKPAI